MNARWIVNVNIFSLIIVHKLQYGSVRNSSVKTLNVNNTVLIRERKRESERECV